MAKFVAIHPMNPQSRLIHKVVAVIREGGVCAIPTDSGYALSCQLENKNGVNLIRDIRRLDEKHNFTLLCRDLSEIAVYARVENESYRLLKSHTPGAYTFILDATREVPRRLQHPKRKQIGIRIPDNCISLEILKALGEPLMTSTLILAGEDMPLTDAYDINSLLGHKLDMVIDGGFCGFEGTSVVDLTGEVPIVIRKGAGDTSAFHE